MNSPEHIEPAAPHPEAERRICALEKELETDGPPFDEWERATVLKHFQVAYLQGRKDGGDAACAFTKAAPQPAKAAQEWTHEYVRLLLGGSGQSAAWKIIKAHQAEVEVMVEALEQIGKMHYQPASEIANAALSSLKEQPSARRNISRARAREAAARRIAAQVRPATG